VVEIPFVYAPVFGPRAQRGHADIVRVLTAAGALCLCVCVVEIPFVYAPVFGPRAQRGHADIVRVLTAAGAHVDAEPTDDDGSTGNLFVTYCVCFSALFF
jgi:hypothetical protein